MSSSDPIVPVKVFRMITHNTHIIVRDVLYAHGMSRLRGVLNKMRPKNIYRDNRYLHFLQSDGHLKCTKIM